MDDPVPAIVNALRAYPGLEGVPDATLRAAAERIQHAADEPPLEELVRLPYDVLRGITEHSMALREHLEGLKTLVGRRRLEQEFGVDGLAALDALPGQLEILEGAVPKQPRARPKGSRRPLIVAKEAYLDIEELADQPPSLGKNEPFARLLEKLFKTLNCTANAGGAQLASVVTTLRAMKGMRKKEAAAASD